MINVVSTITGLNDALHAGVVGFHEALESGDTAHAFYTAAGDDGTMESREPRRSQSDEQMKVLSVGSREEVSILPRHFQGAVTAVAVSMDFLQFSPSEDQAAEGDAVHGLLRDNWFDSSVSHQAYAVDGVLILCREQGPLFVSNKLLEKSESRKEAIDAIRGKGSVQAILEARQFITELGRRVLGVSFNEQAGA